MDARPLRVSSRARQMCIRDRLYTTAGSLVWNTALVGLGAAAGESWQRVARRFADASGAVRWLLLAAAVLAVVWRLARRRERAKK